MEEQKALINIILQDDLKGKRQLENTSIALPVLHTERYLRNSFRYRLERYGRTPIC